MRPIPRASILWTLGYPVVIAACWLGFAYEAWQDRGAYTCTHCGRRGRSPDCWACGAWAMRGAP